MTLYCPRCDTANRAGSVYCNRCGQSLGGPLARACPACGAANLDAARFCQRCGVRLAAADLTPSELSSLLPPEADEPAEADVPLLDVSPEPAASVVVSALPRPGDDVLATMAAALGPLPLASPISIAPFQPSDTVGPPASDGALQANLTFPDVLTAEYPAATVAATGAQAAHPRRNLATRLLYAALVIAVLLPFLVPGEWSGATIPLSPSTAAFYQAVAALKPGTPVILAFDYDSSARSELDVQAQAVTAHLMQRGVRLIAVSLQPQGPALANEVLLRAAPGQNYRPGDDYTNLGYLPGGSAALARLGASVQSAASGSPPGSGGPITGTVMQGVRGVDTVGAVVVFAADEASVLLWITQIQARYKVPLLVGVSATAAAQLQPYVSNGQVQGLLSGLPGAAEYELLLNQPGRAVKMLDAQSLAHGVLVIAILLGNLGYIVTSVRRKRSASKSAA
jgi:hypothetical protein